MMVVRIGLTRSAALVVGHIAGAVVETLAVVRILEEAVTEMCQFVSPLRRYLLISISIYFSLSIYPGHSNFTDEALVDEVHKHNSIAANPR